MNPAVLLTLPTDLEVWLLLGYAAVVLIGAKLTEALASGSTGLAGSRRPGSRMTSTLTTTSACTGSGYRCT